MCLVPDTNATFSVKFFVILGDVAFLVALRAIVEEDAILNSGHVVQYYNRKRSDHRIMVIMSW